MRKCVNILLGSCLIMSIYSFVVPTNVLAENPTLKPVPSADALDSKTKDVKRLFSVEYDKIQTGKSTDPELASLARKLLKLARETPINNPGYFPLLSESIRLATIGKKADVAFESITLLGQSYAINASAMKLEVLKHHNSSDLSIQDVKSAGQLLIRAIQEASDTDQFDSAIEMIAVGAEISKRLSDSSLQKPLVEAKETVPALKKQFDEMTQARIKLESAPQEEVANFAMARYAALRRADWVNAEKYSAKTNDEKLRGLLLQEISSPTDTAAVLRLANDWWDWSEAASGVERLQARDLAAHHFRLVASKLSGFDKRQVETRLTTVSTRRVVAVRVPVAQSRISEADLKHIASEPSLLKIPFTELQARNQQKDTAKDLNIDAEFKNSLGMEFVLIPPGRFRMGSPPNEKGRNEDEEAIDVELTSAFWIGKTEVTQSQWRQIMKTSPWSKKKSQMTGDNFAATEISWNDAHEFIRKLNEKESQIYRLPTEAEWEWSCRAGTAGRWSFGENANDFDQYGWYGGWFGNGNSKKEQYANIVGRKKPNAFGLYDMHGNLWEWCEDARTEKLIGGTDPVVKNENQDKIIRGGSWSHDFPNCRSAERGRFAASSGRDDIGFRLVLDPPNRAAPQARQ